MYNESLSSLIKRAESAMYSFGFKESTIKKSYHHIWLRIINDIGDVSNLTIDDVYNHVESYYGKNLITEETYLLSRRERTIRYFLLELLYFKDYGEFHNSPHYMNSFIDNESLMIMNLYLDYLNGHGLKDKTIKTYRYILVSFLKKCPIKSLNEKTILEYIKSKKGNEPSSVRRALIEVKSFLSYLKYNNYIEDDFKRLFPTHIVNFEGSISSCYTDEEIKNIIETAKNDKGTCSKRNLAILLIIVFYGFRAKDVADLTIDSINFDTSTIKLITSKNNIELEFILFPKVGNSIVEYLLNERPKSNSRKIFLQSNGKEITSLNVSVLINRLFVDSKTNIINKHHGSHSLRSSLATRMMNKNESIYTISKVLGHASINTTKIYTKVDVNHLKLCSLEVPNAR